MSNINFTQPNLPYNVVVNVDTYHASLVCKLSEPLAGEQHTWITDTLVLEHDRDGTAAYKYKHSVILDGEPVATLLSHPRNPKKIKDDRIKMELLNNLLWSNSWMDVKNEIKAALNVMEEIPSRLDIAIDGANHVHKFLNVFAKTSGHKKQAVFMRGKAIFDPGVMDKVTGLFRNFKIGNGDKKIRIYNKTGEIDGVSHKEYIREVWKQADLDLSEDVYRTELRLNSAACKQIKDLQLDNLNNPRYLLQIFKTQIENFFEFVKVTNADERTAWGLIKAKSRAKVIDLFEFCKLNITSLEKVPRAIVRGAYKAKMAIHNVYYLVLTQRLNGERIVHSFEHMLDLIREYNLERWFFRKKDDWIEKYGWLASKPAQVFKSIAAPFKAITMGKDRITVKEVMDEILMYRNLILKDQGLL